MTQVNDVRDAHVETTPAPTVSPWQPLSQPVFRMLWIATVVSNVGSWMSDVGINWSMLTLSADPLDIALVQAASSLPMFLFALPSGVMADIVDRRKYLLFSQLWVFIAAAGLTVLSFTGNVTPAVLLVATFLLSVGAAGYGVMLACIGLGAIAGAILLPRLRQRLDADRLMVAASLTFALTMLALAFVRHVWLLNLFEFFTGFAWIAVLSTLNLGAQRSAARWVKARALAVYLTVFFGSMTAGSAIWGQIASRFGTPTSLVVATLGMVLASATVFRWKLGKDPDLNLDLSGQPLDGVEIDLPNERGPVLVSHEYIIDPQNTRAFLEAVHELRRVRRRAGAMSWAVYEDIERPGLFIETFLMGSWIEHLRQQERHTMNDLLLQSRVLAFHQGTTSPAIRYLVAPV